MNSPLVAQAPAKLNLSLRVLRKREDGFHEIESTMIRIPGLHDQLTISTSVEDKFSCDDPSVPSDQSNLVLKAVDAYRAESGFDQNLTIYLEKRIPHGAGLGGGSSDAATMLTVLNQINDDYLPQEKLIEVAAGLGSDIPFFLGSPTAKVSGRGESIESVDPPPELPVILLKPSFGVATPDAYGRWKDSTELPGVSYGSQKFSWGELANDLERPVFSKHLFLAEMKVWLLERPEISGALMSGSGSTMFAVLRDLDLADRVIRAAKQHLDPTLWSWSGTIGG